MISKRKQLPGPLIVIRESLQAYADRGIFRGFSEVKPGCFKFVWVIHHQMELNVDIPKQELRFKQLLPGVPTGSELSAELKKFIQQKHDLELPEHRRINRQKAEVTTSTRGGFVSLALKVKNQEFAYGVNKIVNLVHELFVYLREVHPDYLVENFDVPQE